MLVVRSLYSLRSTWGNGLNINSHCPSLPLAGQSYTMKPLTRSFHDQSPTLSATLLKAPPTTSLGQILQQTSQKSEQKKPKLKEDSKTAVCQINKIKGSPYKLALLCNQVRGLSFREAVAQMEFSKKKLAVSVKGALVSARYNAENMKNLNPDRLVVDTTYAMKGKYLPRVEFKAKGRTGRIHKPYCKVRVVLREVPPHAKEKRLGRWGKSNEVWKRMTGEQEEGDAQKPGVKFLL